MSNYRLDYAQWRLTIALFMVVFSFALLVYAVSGFDIRQRSAKHACRSGSAEQCLAVGRFYESRTDGLMAFLLSNPVTAETYYDLGCKLGNRASCARLGHMVVVGSYDAARDASFTRSDGLSALRSACDGGERDACLELAAALEPAQAAPILAKLCDGGDKASCDKLAVAYRATDPKRAVELLAKRCEAGEDDPCREGAALLLGRGGEVAADPARAIALLNQACVRSGFAACRELGDAYLDGSLPVDAARGAALLGKACDHDDADACFDLGKSLVASDPAKAVQTFNTECDHGDARGCDALGDLFRVGTTSLARDRDRAFALYRRACPGDDFDCYKARCMSGESDACYKVRLRQRDRRYRLGGAFDMR